MSTPPERHVTAQEAARALEVTDERVRQMVRERVLVGQVIVEQDGARRYWVDSEDLRRLQAERQRPAKVSDVESAQEASRELALRAVAEIIAARLDMSTDAVVAAIAAQKQTVSAEIMSQREEVTALLELVGRRLALMSERQEKLERSVDRGVEILSEQTSKLDARSVMEQQHQERVRAHEQELIEIARNSIQEARRPPRWLVAAVLAILVCAVLGVALIFLIFMDLYSIL